MATNLNKIALSELRCRVDVQRKTLAADGMGGQKISYTTVATVWALIEAWKGKESYRAERTEGLVYQRVVVRGTTDVQMNDIIVFEGRTMPVKYINSLIDGRKKYLEMLCVENDPTGPGAE